MNLDIVLLFGISAALCNACADMFARSGLQRISAFRGAAIIVGGELLFLSVMLPVFGSSFPGGNAKYLWLLAAGVFHPGLFLIFFLIGIEKIGVSRAAPIKGSSPLLGALLGMIFLQERPTWVHLAGLVMVVGGIGLLTSRNPHGRWKRADTAWPAAAALSFGAGSLLWRKGLDGLPDPLAATFVGVLASFIVVGGYAMLTTRTAPSSAAESKGMYFLISGLTTGCGMYLYVRALQHGEIYRVLPLVQMSPLFTVALSMLFLRRMEKVTWEVAAGAVITVAGAVLVAFKPWAFS